MSYVKKNFDLGFLRDNVSTALNILFNALLISGFVILSVEIRKQIFLLTFPHFQKNKI